MDISADVLGKRVVVVGRCSMLSEGVARARELEAEPGTICRCEEVRDGGLKGRGEDRSDNGVFAASSRDPDAFTVDEEDEEVPDSRTAVRP